MKPVLLLMTSCTTLKHRLLVECRKLDHSIVVAAASHCRRRLSACVREHGGHFQHILWCTLTPFWSNFITGWKWTTMHKMVHFAMLQPNIAQGPGQDAFYHASNRTTRPKWLVLRKLCELIVLRVVKALSHLDDLASVCPTYENLANTLTYVE